MKIDWMEYTDVWAKVKRAARTTVSKDGSGEYPSDVWKKSILLAEHSPIRRIWFTWRWSDLKSWVSVHFVRHGIGVSHFVSTQRTDRTGVDRDKSPQDTPVFHECDANVQELIYISRKRLCTQAAPETRAAWLAVKQRVSQEDPMIGSVMVPECIYRGFCPEMKPCGYAETDEFRERLAEYRNRGGVTG